MEFAWKKYLAEFYGTGILVLFGLGAALMMGPALANIAGIIGVALVFGIVLLSLVYLIGGTSGCHVNPAVSLGMAIAGRLSWKDCILYMIAQFIGAIAGAALLMAIFAFTPGGAFPPATLGQNGFDAQSMMGLSVWGALLVEVVLTCIFVGVILAVTKNKENSRVAGVVIGLTLMLVHLFGIALTGTSVNPARSLAPAIFVGGTALAQVWVFLVAPLAGGAIAGLIGMFCKEKVKEPAKDTK